MSAKYQRHPQLAGRVVEGLAFIVTTDNKLQTLNEAATVIWQACAEACDVEKLAAAMVAEFQVDSQTAHKDAEDFVHDLLRRGILVEASA